jgi:hypothetical protein
VWAGFMWLMIGTGGWSVGWVYVVDDRDWWLECRLDLCG